MKQNKLAGMLTMHDLQHPAEIFENDIQKLGMLIPAFLQTRFQLLITSLKLVFDFTGIHRSLNFKPS